MGNYLIAAYMVSIVITVSVMLWRRHKLINKACDSIKLSPEAKERMREKIREMYEANDDREPRTTADIFNLIKELEQIQGNKVIVKNAPLSILYGKDSPLITEVRIPYNAYCNDVYYFIEEYVKKQRRMLRNRFNHASFDKISSQFDAIKKINETIEQYENLNSNASHSSS